MRFCSKLGSYGEVFFVFEVVVFSVESPKVFLDFDWVLELDWFDGITWAVKFGMEDSEYWRDGISNDLDVFRAKLTPPRSRRSGPPCLAKRFNSFEGFFNRAASSPRSRPRATVVLTGLALFLFRRFSSSKARRVSHSLESESQYAMFVSCCDWRRLLVLFQGGCSVPVVEWSSSIAPRRRFWPHNGWYSDVMAVIKHGTLQSVKHGSISWVGGLGKWASSMMMREKTRSHASDWGVILDASSPWLSARLKIQAGYVQLFDPNQWAQNSWVRR